MKLKLVLLLNIVFFVQIPCYAFLISPSYKVTNISTYNTPNSEYKISYSYRLFGNIIGTGYEGFSGATINLYPEVLGLSRGPEVTVEKAYAFPNPCNLRYGCNGVAFTKLTLICEIRIFTISGEHVATINKNSNNESISWDLKDKNGKIVSSGLYIFYIKDNGGNTRKGKLVIIR
ncbi:MAG: T9SS type A sorting domain-containing protein [Elusimicrobiota bacterium]